MQRRQRSKPQAGLDGRIHTAILPQAGNEELRLISDKAIGCSLQPDGNVLLPKTLNYVIKRIEAELVPNEKPHH